MDVEGKGMKVEEVGDGRNGVAQSRRNRYRVQH